MSPLDINLLQQAAAYLASAIKAARVNADTQAIVETQSAVSLLNSILSRNTI